MPPAAPVTSAPPKVTSKVWYILAAGLMTTAVAIAATAFGQWRSTIEEMPRVVVPGRSEIVLPPGDTTLYAESRSLVNGKAYVLDGAIDFRCGIKSASGTPVPIEKPTSQVSYGLGGYEGRNVFDVHAETGGTYVLECEGDAQKPFVLAIGRGVGTWIVVGLVGGIVPGMLAVVVFVIVLVKRSRQKRRARAQAAMIAP
jgi:hypothetical protein